MDFTTLAMLAVTALGCHVFPQPLPDGHHTPDGMCPRVGLTVDSVEDGSPIHLGNQGLALP